jgi:hypothetical protein
VDDRVSRSRPSYGYVQVKRNFLYLDQPGDPDYVTLHNILYYIYTESIHLPGLKPVDAPQDYPELADPFSVYCNAHKFSLPGLQELCLDYLKTSLTPESVSERLFHPNCQDYMDLQKVYFDYLVSNFEEVMLTKGWETIFRGDSNLSSGARVYRDNLVLKITQAAFRKNSK